MLGQALYRNDRFAEAETLLLGSLHRNPGWICEVLHWLALSMVEQRLGRPGEARRWLEQAERWVAVRLRGRPGGVDRAIPENWHWRDGILLHLLLREARAGSARICRRCPGTSSRPRPERRTRNSFFYGGKLNRSHRPRPACAARVGHPSAPGRTLAEELLHRTDEPAGVEENRGRGEVRFELAFLASELLHRPHKAAGVQSQPLLPP